MKYCISGGVSAVALLFFLYVFHGKIGFPVVISSVLAYAISLCVGFVMQKFWTWNETIHAQTSQQFFRYAVIGICNTGLNAFGMYIFAVRFSVWYVASQIIVAGIIAVWSYLLYRRFVFIRNA